MSEQDDILCAYHRAVARRRDRTRVSWPLTRAMCCLGDGTITDTNVFEPQVVGRWRRDSLGRITARLV